MGRAKYTPEEARDMVRKQHLWSKPFYTNFNGTNDKGPGEETQSAIANIEGDDEAQSTTSALKGETLVSKLLLLPREIRDKIFRHLLCRPIAILPGPVREKCSIRWRHKPVVAVYSYQWDDRRQRGHEDWGLPTYDGREQGVRFAWRSEPTAEQLALINSHAMSIPMAPLNSEIKLDMYTYDENLGAYVSHYLVRRRGSPLVIINRAVITTCGLSTSILQTCKQIHTEGCAILYGENTFVFDTCGQSPYTHHRGVHEHDAFDKAPWQIPGLPQNGRPQAVFQTRMAIEYMFERQKFHQPFMRRDPMSTFFRAIGRVNASFLTSIKIEGFMRTAENDHRYRDNRPISFARILPIHTTMLKNLCPNLRKLIIHQGNNDELWEDDLEGHLGLSNEQRVDHVIEGVVNALPGLQELELGSYHFTPSEGNVIAQWGKALRWEELVKERLRENVRKAKEREERAVLDQYIWKDNKKGGRKGENNKGKQEKVLNPFASLVDSALAAVDEAGGDKGGHRPSFRKGKKGRRGENC